MPLSDLEPMLPDVAPLRERASGVVRAAAELGRHLHPATLRAVAELVRTINCYYSNLIEGHDTHPVSIERAMRDVLSADRRTRDLQLEAKAHIETQRAIERRLDDEPGSNVCTARFLAWAHSEFYRHVPASLRVVRHPTEERLEVVVPGALREFDVRVGRHVAPTSAELDALLERFGGAYDPALHAGDPARGLAVLGAAHHRLLWIHPFGDGNGRVTRLMTDAYLRRIGIGGHGLWTVSRGLARARERYRQALAGADQPRWNDLDGRGTLSARGLLEFCEFFIDVCADQVEYMGRLLDVEGLAARFAAYCRARESGALAPGPEAPATPSRSGRPPSGFRPEGTRLLRAILAGGPLPRREALGLTGLAERTARRLVHELADEGFLWSASHRAPLELRFPAHAAPYIFPELYGPELR